MPGIRAESIKSLTGRFQNLQNPLRRVAKRNCICHWARGSSTVIGSELSADSETETHCCGGKGEKNVAVAMRCRKVYYLSVSFAVHCWTVAAAVDELARLSEAAPHDRVCRDV